MKKCKHKWILGSMEMKGKTFDNTCYVYFCEKCGDERREKHFDHECRYWTSSKHREDNCLICKKPLNEGI